MDNIVLSLKQDLNMINVDHMFEKNIRFVHYHHVDIDMIDNHLFSTIHQHV